MYIYSQSNVGGYYVGNIQFYFIIADNHEQAEEWANENIDSRWDECECCGSRWTTWEDSETDISEYTDDPYYKAHVVVDLT